MQGQPAPQAQPDGDEPAGRASPLPPGTTLQAGGRVWGWAPELSWGRLAAWWKGRSKLSTSGKSTGMHCEIEGTRGL